MKFNRPLLIALLGASWVTSLVGLQQVGPQQVGVPQSFSITITTQSTVVTSGAEVRIVSELKNISDHEITVARSPSPEQGELYTEIDVRAIDGNPVPETKYYRVLRGKERAEVRKDGGKITRQIITGSMASVQLKPGETLKDEIIASKLVDLTT